MKRLISTLLSLCIVGGVIQAIPQYAPESVVYAEYPINPQIPRSIDRNGFDECTEGILTYWVFPDFAIARSTFDEERPLAYGDIVIPSEYRGVPVTGVMLFEDCTELTSITLPDTVTQIAENTFLNCTSLETINIPKSVNRIYYNAFEGTPWLEKKRNESPMVIVNNILVDGKKCEGEVVIPDNVTSIADQAFMNCESIESVSIPDSVEYIGRQAFYNTGWLNKLNEENELVIVNDFLLSVNDCDEDLVIPDNVKSVTGHTADYHETLKSITIPESVKHIGVGAFYCCPNLESVTILSTDCEIESDYAFCNELRYKAGYFNGTIYGYAGSTAYTYAQKFRCKFEPLPGYSILKGDANIDGYANIADAVLVIQVATNPDKYAQGKSEFSITAQGEINADVDGKSGLSNSDAVLIQKLKLGLIKEL